MNARRSEATCVGQSPSIVVVTGLGYPTRVVVFVHADDDPVEPVGGAPCAPSKAVWETRALAPLSSWAPERVFHTAGRIHRPRPRNDRRGCPERRLLDLALPVYPPWQPPVGRVLITAWPAAVASGTRSCAASRNPSARGGAHRGAAGRRSRRLGSGPRSRHASRSRGAGWR